MIVVMPNGNPNCQAAPGEWSFGLFRSSFMGNSGPKNKPVASMEESFNDIVSYIDSHYKTIKSRAGRAVCGLSMGGGHTFGISRLYPTEFDYYGLFSAGLGIGRRMDMRSEEHTSELQSRQYLVCRLLLEKKKITKVLYNE